MLDGDGFASEISPHGYSRFLMDLGHRRRVMELSKLGPEMLERTLRELPRAMREEFFRRAPLKKLAEFFEVIRDKSAVKFIQEVPAPRARRILNRLSREKRELVEELMNYPAESAGRLMTTQIFRFQRGTPVEKVLRRIAADVPDVVYVVDGEQFFGQVKTKMLAFMKGKRLEEIADRDVLTINPETDQEMVVEYFKDSDEAWLPVVDGLGRLVGAISVDDVLDVLHKEMSEDLARITGSTDDVEDMTYSPAWKAVRSRIPWLMFTVVGEMVFTGNIIAYFDGLLEKYIALSFFLPVLMCLSGDSSIQSSIVAIQGLSRDRIKDERNFLLRDLKVGVLLGLLLGGLAMLIALVWLRSLKLGTIVGISIITSLVAANFIGTMLPIVFKKMGKDPAVSTGPLLTTTMDVISMSIYFITATILLEILLA